jgi:hypothetical protein
MSKDDAVLHTGDLNPCNVIGQRDNIELMYIKNVTSLFLSSFGNTSLVHPALGAHHGKLVTDMIIIVNTF